VQSLKLGPSILRLRRIRQTVSSAGSWAPMSHSPS